MVAEADMRARGERTHAIGSIRVAYCRGFAAIGVFGPFATLYYRDLGFSGLEVGILAALPAVALTVAGPFWGAAADALSAHRLVLWLALLLAALFALVPSRPSTF